MSSRHCSAWLLVQFSRVRPGHAGLIRSPATSCHGCPQTGVLRATISMLNKRLMGSSDCMRIGNDPILLPVIGRDSQGAYKSNDVLDLLIIEIGVRRHD